MEREIQTPRIFCKNAFSSAKFAQKKPPVKAASKIQKINSQNLLFYKSFVDNAFVGSHFNDINARSPFAC